MIDHLMASQLCRTWAQRKSPSLRSSTEESMVWHEPLMKSIKQNVLSKNKIGKAHNHCHPSGTCVEFDSSLWPIPSAKFSFPVPSSALNTIKCKIGSLKKMISHFRLVKRYVISIVLCHKAHERPD